VTTACFGGSLTQRHLVLLSAIMTAVCIWAFGCQKNPYTVWQAEARSPDGVFLATARGLQSSGRRNAYATTSVYLQRESQDSVEVLGFDNNYGAMWLQMKWLTPRHLEVSYGPRTSSDIISVEFQVVKVADVEISLRRGRAGSPR
jgi:hypothetical protein